jgi:2-methylcitrate dehydratase PrpD
MPKTLKLEDLLTEINNTAKSLSFEDYYPEAYKDFVHRLADILTISMGGRAEEPIYDEQQGWLFPFTDPYGDAITSCYDRYEGTLTP